MLLVAILVDRSGGWLLRKPMVVLSLASALLVALALPALPATPPPDVHIEVETSLLGAPSPFVASE
jgi:hypothetical protein